MSQVHSKVPVSTFHAEDYVSYASGLSIGNEHLGLVRVGKNMSPGERTAILSNYTLTSDPTATPQ